MYAYIYKLIDCRNDKILYVGSTTWPLGKRLSGHKTDCRRGKEGARLRQTMFDVGLHNVTIQPLQRFRYKTKEDIRKRELQWINKLQGFKKGNSYNPL